MSPSQVILLMLAHCIDNKMKGVSIEKGEDMYYFSLERLKQLYLCGMGTYQDHDDFEILLKHSLLADYQVSFELDVINADPSRRYFETHLSYHTLTTQLDNINRAELRLHLQQLLATVFGSGLPQKIDALELFNPSKDLKNNSLDGFKSNLKTLITELILKKPQTIAKLKKVFPEVFPAQKNYQFDPENENDEFAEYIDKIRSGAIFPTFKDKDKDKDKAKNQEKIIMLVQCFAIGVLAAQQNPDKQFHEYLTIYNEGFFLETARGREYVRNIEKVDRVHNGDKQKFIPLNFDTYHYGLMKRYMPLALDDIARSDSLIRCSQASQYKFLKGASWNNHVKDNGNQIFSSSISGSMCAHLRVHGYLCGNDKSKSRFTNNKIKDNSNMPSEQKNIGATIDNNKLLTFYQLFISSMLFFSGGHGLYEFVAPLTLLSVRKAYEFVPGFDQINLESMFLTKNETAFDHALLDTLNYHRTLLAHQKVLEEVHSYHEMKELKQKVLEELPSAYEIYELQQLQQRFPVLSKKVEDAFRQYQSRIDNQLFSQWRKGYKKNRMIQKSEAKIIASLHNLKFNEAIDFLKDLLRTLKPSLNASQKNSSTHSLIMIEGLIELIEDSITEIQAFNPSHQNSPRPK